MMSMQLQQTTQAPQKQKLASYPLEYSQKRQVYTLNQPQREMVQKDLVSLQAAQQRLQKQATLVALSQTQAKRLETINHLVEQLSSIVSGLEKSHTIPEGQLKTIREASDLCSQLKTEKRLKIAQNRVEIAGYPVDYQYEHQLFALKQPQRELLQNEFQQLQIAQKVLQEQSKQDAFSETQASLLRTLNEVIEQTADIMATMEQSHTIPEYQWGGILKMRELHKQLSIGGDGHSSVQRSAQLRGASLSAIGDSQPPSDPPPDDKGMSKDVPTSSPRTRVGVVKDMASRYFTKGGVIFDLVLGTVLGALFAIGSPVMAVTIPSTLAVLFGIKLAALAMLFCRDPNGDYMNHLYKGLEQYDVKMRGLTRQESGLPKSDSAEQLIGQPQ